MYPPIKRLDLSTGSSLFTFQDWITTLEPTVHIQDLRVGQSEKLFALYELLRVLGSVGEENLALLRLLGSVREKYLAPPQFVLPNLRTLHLTGLCSLKMRKSCAMLLEPILRVRATKGIRIEHL